MPMKKKACTKKFRKKYLRQPSIDFDFCNISSSCDVVYKGLFVYCMGVTKWEGDSNFIHWFCTRVQYDFLLHRKWFLLINMLENGISVLLLANRKTVK
jgi:hypothetical protein